MAKIFKAQDRRFEENGSPPVEGWQPKADGVVMLTKIFANHSKIHILCSALWFSSLKLIILSDSLERCNSRYKNSFLLFIKIIIPE